MLSKLNQARSSGRYCGGEWFGPTAPLRFDERIFNAAFVHSTDMANHDYYSHNGRDGSSGTDRIRRMGYMNGAGSWATGENIAYGYRTVDQAFEGWINSPAHCKNIMNPRFVHTGFTCRYNPNSDKKYFWTQNFGFRG
jgi:uncharacterized protein YkwD